MSVSDRQSVTGIDFIIPAEYIRVIGINDIFRAEYSSVVDIPFPAFGGADDIVLADHV